MKQAFKVLSLLTLIYLIGQFVFNLLLSEFNEDLTGSIFIVLTTLVFIMLFSKGMGWAKWTLSVLLILTGVMSMLAGFIIGPMGTIIGVYNIFFGVYVHKGRPLRILMYQQQKTPMASELSNDDYMNIGEEEQVYHFPSLLQRYKALFIDGFLMMAALIAIMLLADGMYFRTEIMIIFALILLLTYEPLLTAYSATVGQRLMKIKVVRNDDPYTRISLVNAYKRWFTKAVLGWVSFITINYEPRHRAMHDIASDSVVVNN
ncbi:MAG: RDD family protein [Chryseolinea sp.]